MLGGDHASIEERLYNLAVLYHAEGQIRPG